MAGLGTTLAGDELSAQLFNIGAPRALGHAIGLNRRRFINPYPPGSQRAIDFTAGFFEGDEESYNDFLFIEPDDATGDDEPQLA